jgi:hypothetical protein
MVHHLEEQIGLFARQRQIADLVDDQQADEATKAQPGCERFGAGKRRTEQNQETVEKAGTAPANSSFTKRCCTACDQPASLAARMVSVKRSGITSVPV